MPRHKDIRPSDVHSVIAWHAGNQTERQAISPDVEDIGKFLYQSDIKGFFLLKGVNPADWQDMTLAQVGNHYHTEFEPKDATILKSAAKGVANGLATLGSDGKITSTQLPSYIDDVLEYTNLVGLPATGEASKIYVVTSTNKQYRWSGSAYVEMTSSPGTTDSVVEGTTNKYFTDARAQAALSASLALKADKTYVDNSITTATANSYSNGVDSSVLYYSFAGANNSTLLKDVYTSKATMDGTGGAIKTNLWPDGAFDNNSGAATVTIPCTSDLIFGAGKFTLEFWASTTSTTGLDGNGAIVSVIQGPNWYINQGHVGYSGGWGLTLNPRDINLGFFNWNRTLATNVNGTAAWQHIALTSDGTHFNMFIDGVLRSSNTTSSFENGATSGNIIIGDKNFQGQIRDLRISRNIVLYTSNFTPKASLAILASNVLTNAEAVAAIGFTPVNAALVGSANGVATLGSDGKIPQSQVPNIALTDTFVVASQAAMLALTTAERGDICVRTDLNKTFILKNTRYDLLGDWQELATPTDAVLSVFGRTGAVSLLGSDVTEALGYTPYNATNPNGYITANQSIALSGDVVGTGSTSITSTLSATGVTPGTYSKVTVDAKGRATGGAQLNSTDVANALGFTPSADKPRVSKCSFPGTVAIKEGTARWYPEVNATITQVYFSLGTASSGTVTIDVKKNGTTIFTTKPSASAGWNKSAIVNVNAAITINDSITVSIVAGSDGADLVAFIVY